jgi:hypothetical protein
MVLKRQLPSRVSPDEAAKPSGQGNAPVKPNIEAEWPAPPAEKPAAASLPAGAEGIGGAELPPLPPIPALPPLEAAPAAATPAPVEDIFEKPAVVAAETVPAEQPAAEAAPSPVPEAAPAQPAAPADTTPSKPSDDTPRRRVKTPRSFTAQPEATAAPAAQAKVENPIAEAPERLASAGVIEPKPADPLTANLPSTPPVATEPAQPQQPENIFAMPGEEPAAPAPQTPAAPLAAPASDLPWASGAATTEAKVETTSADTGWDIETPAPPAAPSTPAPQTPAAPPPDVFRDVAVSRSAEGPIPSMPWSKPSDGRGAPELPASSISSKPRGGSFQLVLAAAAVAGVLFVAYTLVTRTDSTQERLARLTGSLREAPEVIPGSPSSTNPAVQPNLQPEKVIAMSGQSGTILPPPAVAGGPANATFQPLQPTTSGTTVVDFTDVPPGEAGKPIVADGSEKMPEDIGFVASLQQAIAKEKAKEGGQPGAIQKAEADKVNDKNLTQEQKLKRGEDLKAQLDDELAAYRKALADAPAPALAPKPTDFFKDKGYMDGKASAAIAASGTLLLPPTATSGSAVTAAATAKQGVEGLPPAELYAHNPKNLPVLPEPTEAEQPKVRQLADFNVNVFQPEEPQVRMPKGVRPSIAAGDFPSLDILSLVPGRGLIAYYQGKEGVLLVGEKVAGWRLVGVNATTAEFSSGEKRQTVRAD